MNPRESNQVERLFQVERQVLCAHYNSCLEVAVEKHWAGFTCSECEAFMMEGTGNPYWWECQAENARRLLLKAGYVPKGIMNRIRNHSNLQSFAYEQAEVV